MVDTEVIPPPASCPGCRAAWSPDGRCPRCGLLLSEATAWLRAGCTHYMKARQAASEGRFADARELLGAVRLSGIAELVNHPAVLRLEELCASTLGNSGAAARIAAGDEAAARNAVGRCDFRAAAFYAGRAARAQPENLALQKLHLLTLYGVGRMREATAVYAELQAVAPADPDMLRWRFAEIPVAQGARPRRQAAATFFAAAGCAVGLWWAVRSRGKRQ